MTVLKSFELNGNKQSFANWISNLSPKDVPFTSMIGKEKIDQTQYSWQTDALAPANQETILEGEQFELQPRASTEVLTNFTSTLRKVVRVSDTAMKVTTHGRSNEMAYQLKKTSSELLRDMEYMNLSGAVGQPGTETQPSRHAGFKSLVAAPNHPDQDTKSIVHKEIPWMVGTSAFTLKDIFDITTNLYISGSKANKIMFHPINIDIFSDHIGYNEEEPNIHRVFEGLDDKFNMQVCKIKDPLGRLYMLIPNRYMPQNEVYFFHEDDWTQTILRSPQRIKIGKNGSYDTVMIETEIGLRHRHPYASGVLSLVRTDKHSHITTTRNVLTAYTGDDDEMVFVDVLDTGDNPVPDLAISWETSDSDVISLRDATDKTDAAGQSHVSLTTHKPGNVTIIARGDKMLSEPIHIEVREPIIKMEVDSPAMDIGSRMKCDTTVTRHVTWAPTDDGTSVEWHSNSPHIAFLSDPADVGSMITESATVHGTATAYVVCIKPGTYRIWSSTSGVKTKEKTIYIGKAQLQMTWTKKKSKLTIGLDDHIEFEVEIKDKDGVPVGPDVLIDWTSSDDNLMTVSSATSLTNAESKASVTVHPKYHGDATIRAYCYGDEVHNSVRIVTLDVDTIIIPNTIPITSPVTNSSKLQTFVLDSDANPVVGVDVTWAVASVAGTSIELGSIVGTTDGQGVAETTLKGIKKGSGTITSVINGINYSTKPFDVGQGASMSFTSSPNPSEVGEEITFSGKLTDKSGVGIADQKVTFLAEHSGGRFEIPETTTGPLGTFESRVTPLVAGSYKIDAICASLGSSRTFTQTINSGHARLVAKVARSVATFGVGQVINLTAQLFDKTRSLANVPISIADPNGLFQFTINSGVTDATGKWETGLVVLGNPGTSTTIFVECEGNALGVPMSIEAPVVKIEVAPNPVIESTDITATASVFFEDGTTPADKDVEVDWHVFPSVLPEFNLPKYYTNAQGKVITTAKVNTNSDITFKAVVGTAESNEVDLKVGTFTAEITSDTTGNMSSNINEQRTFRAKAYIAGQPAAGKPMVLTSSNPNIISIEGGTQCVTNASGEYAFIGVSRTTTGAATITAVITDPLTGETTTGSTNITVRNPKVNVILNETSMKIHTELVFEIQVLDQNNDPVAGIEVEPSCDIVSAAVICNNYVTDKDGKIYPYLAPIEPGTHRVRGKVGTFSGLTKTITVENSVQSAEIIVEPLGIGGKTMARAYVSGAGAAPLAGATVNWSVNPSSVVISGLPTSTTDANGFATVELTGVSRGTGVVSFEVDGMTAPDKSFLVGQGATVTTSHSPMTPLINQDVTHKVVLKRTSDGAPIVNTDVILSCVPAIAAFSTKTVTTNAQGLAEFTHQFIDENTHTINALVPSLTANTAHVVKVRDLRITSEISKPTMVYNDAVPAVFTVRMMNNTTPISGASLEMRCIPDGCVFEYPNGRVTDSQGYLRVNVVPRDIGNFQLSARSEGIESNKSALTVTDIAFRYSVSGADRFMTAHIGQTSAVTCGVLEFGVPAVWKTLRYSTHDVDMIDIIPRDGGSAGATGFNTIDINPKKVGKSLIRVQADGAAEFVEFTVEAKDPIVHLNCSPNPADGTEDVNYTLKVTDVHGAAAQGVSLELYHTAIFNNYVPRGNSDANGELLHIRKIAQPGTYPMQTYIPHASHVRSPMMNMVIKDRPYVYSVLGNLTKATNGIDLTHEVTIVVRENNVLQSGVVIEHRSDSQMVSVSGNRYSTDAAGTLILLVKPKKTGVARIEFKAKGNSEWHHFDLTIGAPELRIVVSPTTVQAGKDITFSASVRDANANYVPGKTIKWSHPVNMLMNQYKLPDAVGDPLYGSVTHTARAGAWGTHQVFWYVEDINVRSNIVNVTSHM